MNLPDEPEAAAFLLKLFAEIADRFGLVPKQEEQTMGLGLTGNGNWDPIQNGLRMWTWSFDQRPCVTRIHYLTNGAISFDATINPPPPPAPARSGEVHGPWVIFLPDDGARTARALAEMDRPRLFRYLGGFLHADEKRGIVIR